jgi:hypothetical protein
MKGKKTTNDGNTGKAGHVKANHYVCPTKAPPPTSQKEKRHSRLNRGRSRHSPPYIWLLRFLFIYIKSSADESKKRSRHPPPPKSVDVVIFFFKFRLAPAISGAIVAFNVGVLQSLETYRSMGFRID